MTVNLDRVREMLKKKSIEIKRKELLYDKKSNNDDTTDKADGENILNPHYF